jgi:hypothetical protein
LPQPESTELMNISAAEICPPALSNESQVTQTEKLKVERDGLVSRYNREKLYEQVWAQPVRDVAKLYGISDVRLGKVCRKLLIPVPPRGFWARLRSGYNASRPLLPKLRLSECESVFQDPAQGDV